MQITKTILQWQYKPVNFFEVPLQYSESGYILKIENGNAEAALITPHETVPEKVQKDIENKVASFLKARMLLKHKTFELGPLHIQQHRADGSIGTLAMISGKARIIKAEGMSADILLTDATGRVIRDTKAERIAEEEAFILLVANATGTHPVINKLIESYTSAVADAPDELVHLYEIIDALKSHFTTRQNAIRELTLSEDNWDRLHDLANNQPLKEGRHRGGKELLRNATEEELSEARKIARDMIYAFLNFVPRSRIKN